MLCTQTCAITNYNNHQDGSNFQFGSFEVIKIHMVLPKAKSKALLSWATILLILSRQTPTRGSTRWPFSFSQAPPSVTLRPSTNQVTQSAELTLLSCMITTDILNSVCLKKDFAFYTITSRILKHPSLRYCHSHTQYLFLHFRWLPLLHPYVLAFNLMATNRRCGPFNLIWYFHRRCVEHPAEIWYAVSGWNFTLHNHLLL